MAKNRTNKVLHGQYPKIIQVNTDNKEMWKLLKK